jgi:hypothetical protein
MLSRCIRAPATACLLRGVRLEIQPKLGQAQGRLRSLAFGGCGSPQSPQALRNDLIEGRAEACLVDPGTLKGVSF